MFVDPYLIYLCKDEFSYDCSNKIVNYFGQLLTCAKNNDRINGLNLVEYLQENNEVRFGYSKGKARGKGLGKIKGEELFNIIADSKAVKSGLIKDIFDASIMLDNVGFDKISDLTINIILENLIEFTQQQCSKHHIPMIEVKLRRPIWCHQKNLWITKKKVLLPVDNNLPIIFIPKKYARRSLVYSYKRFYELQMMPFYETMALSNPSSGLVRILKRGYVAAKTKIRKKFPCNKCNVIEYINQKPEEYIEYKEKQMKYISSNRV